METNTKKTSEPISIEATNKETGKELIKHFYQKGTPFTIVKKYEEKEDTYNYYIVCHGRVMTYPYKSFKEAKDAIRYHSWDLLTAFVFLVSEITKNTENNQTTGREIKQ